MHTGTGSHPPTWSSLLHVHHGVSTYLSLRKFNFEPSEMHCGKLRRTTLIFVIGWLGMVWSAHVDWLRESLAVAATHFETLRILGCCNDWRWHMALLHSQLFW